MSDSGHSRILSASDAVGLTGRERELEAVLGHSEAAAGRALLLASAPGLCASELLREAYDRLFRAGRGIVPVYFKFLPSDGSAREAARRFLREFLVQYVAFRRREERLVRAHPDVCEVAALAPAIDEDWIADAARSCEMPTELNGEAAFIAKAFAAPQRAAVSGARCFIIIDGLENTLLLDGADDLAALLDRVLTSGAFPYVLSGKRRLMESLVSSSAVGAGGQAPLLLEPFDLDRSAEAIRAAAGTAGVSMTSQSVDLASVILDARPWRVRALLQSGVSDLRSFRDVLSAYFGLLDSGRLGGYFDTLLRAAADPDEIPALIGMMNDMAANLSEAPARAFAKRMKGGNGLRYLQAFELVDLEFDKVRLTGDPVFRDYLETRARSLVAGESAGRRIAGLVGSGLKKAAGRMSAVYRRVHAIGVSDLVSRFDCQEVPLALLDYGIFNQSYKGMQADELLAGMRGDLERLKLPQVFYADRAAEFYPPLAEIIDDERAAVGFGFEHGEYDDESEVAWLVAEIESKLEATEELASFWCDRLEMAAVANDIGRFRIWLIAPEGFSPAALEALHDRRAIGSSRAQVGLLRRLLETGELASDADSAEQFELVIPMGEDTELIAAHAVEDIARKAGFETAAVNQIKTALVEACINAAEHSMSPDGKIAVAVEFGHGRLEITVSNRGIRFSGGDAETGRGSEERRGWGLKLMRSLMDEVRFERVDDGTKIVMAKLIESPQD